MKQQSRRRVLVTGSSRGLGRAIALELAGAGFDLVLHCRDRLDEVNEVKRQAEELGATAHVLRFDVGDRSAVQVALDGMLEGIGALYGVVLNAGLTRDGIFPAMSESDWDEVLRVNLDGFYNVLHPCVMPMVRLRQGGRIVVLSSVSGMVGQRGQVNYSASKAGLIGATKALAQELASRRISVNCVAPGFIESDMTAKLPVEEINARVPMGRLGRPEEVAALVGFLFTERAEYLTGQVISINGGLA